VFPMPICSGGTQYDFGAATNFTNSNAYENTLAQVRDNLRQMQLVYFDLVVVDSDIGLCTVMREQWRALEDAYEAGLARAIGVANYCEASFECLKSTWRHVPHVNQIQYHVGMTKDPDGIKSYCESLGIQVQSFSVLGGAEVMEEPGGGVAPLGVSPPKPEVSLTKNSKLRAIGGRLGGWSSAAVAIRWAFQNGFAVITKTTSRAHLKESVQIFGWSLSADQMAELDAPAALGTRNDFYSLSCNCFSSSICLGFDRDGKPGAFQSESDCLP